jgi:hypothetical protein
MMMRDGFKSASRLGLALGLTLWVGACGAAVDDDFSGTDEFGEFDDEAVDTARDAMAKGPVSGGKCHVKFGGFILVGSGTYSSSGECCGKTRCTNDCDGQKYVDVCILCSADADVTCEDGHHPVAFVPRPTLRSNLKVMSR